LIGAPADYHQKTLIAQLAETVFAGFPIGFFFLTVVTALILVLVGRGSAGKSASKDEPTGPHPSGGGPVRVAHPVGRAD
ncbi:hypothetical protein, partial [Nocardia cyriacigeorgica]|uniref:hypothetical protein n=1 Tax=Nocardia cyriacigeorgica TaxID=135487 RepID=UPI0024569F32